MFIDGHADTLSKILAEQASLFSNNAHFDITRALASRVQMQVLALFTSEKSSEEARKNIYKQIDYFYDQMHEIEDIAFHVMEADDLTRLSNDRIGLMLHLEGGDAVGRELSRISDLYSRGVRSMGLTWNYGNAIATGILDVEPEYGLTDFGREVIVELNRLKMVVDVAHASHKTFYDVLESTKSPLWVSHANVFSLCRHPRNLTDDQIKAIKEVNGIIGICFVPGFVGPENNLDHLVDHICYICEMIGIDHAALGSDFDGTDITVIPDVSKLTTLIDKLQHRQFTIEEIKKIAGGNLLRLLKQIL
ncbi:MAG: dipeptidase [Candidatus Saccharibacteria bacterium]